MRVLLVVAAAAVAALVWPQGETAHACRSPAARALAALPGHEILSFEYRVDRPPAPQVMRPRIQG